MKNPANPLSIEENESFSSVFLIDADSGAYRAMLLHPVFCSFAKPEGQWDGFLREYAEHTVTPEDRNDLVSKMNLDGILAAFGTGVNVIKAVFRRSPVAQYPMTYCRMSAIPMEKSGDGKPVKILLTLIDVSSEVIAKARLGEIERNKKFFDFSLSGVDLFLWKLDIERDEITFADNPFTRRRKEEIGYPDIVHHASRYIMANVMEESVPTMQRIFRDIHAGRPFTSGDIHFRAGGDQGYTVCRVSYQTILDKDGKPIFAYGSELNVTEQLLMREAYTSELKHFDNEEECVFKLRANLTHNAIIAASPDDFGLMKFCCYDEVLRRPYFDSNIIGESMTIRDFLSRDALIRSFAVGKRRFKKTYRYPGQADWRIIESSVALFHNPDTNDIEMFLYAKEVTNAVIKQSIVDCLTANVFENIGIIDPSDNSYRLQAQIGERQLVTQGSYDERIDEVLTHIPEDSKHYVREELSIDKIVASLKKKDSYEFSVFEDWPSGKKRILRRYSWLNDSKSLILIVSSDVTSAFNAQEEMKQEIKGIRHIHEAFVEGLNKIHNSEVLVDLREKTYYMYKEADTFTANPNGTFDEMYALFINSFTEDNPAHAYFQKTLTIESLRETLKDGRLLEHDYYRVLPDGSKRYFAFNIMAVNLNEEEGVRYVLVATTDITETVLASRKMEKELAEANSALQHETAMLRSFRNIYEQSLYIDLKTGSISPINMPASYQKLIEGANMNVEKAAALFAEHVVKPRFADEVRPFMDVATLSKRLTENGVVSLEVEGMNGRWYRANLIPVNKDDDGNVVSTIFAVQDIDAAKRREILLAKRIEDDQEIIQKASVEAYDHVSVIDIASKTITLRGGGWYTDDSEELRNKRSVSYPELLKHIGDDHCVSKEERDLFLKRFDLDNVLSELSSKKDVTFLVNVYGENDCQKALSKQYRFSYLGKDKKNLLVCRMDITESLDKEKTLNQQMKDALQIAEAANNAKSEFLSRMSHDIRTPMNAIIGFSTLLVKTSADPGVTDTAKKILVSSNHLLGLINEVLDMSKIESGKIQMSVREFEFSALVELVDGIMRPQAEGKRQSFEIYAGDIKHDRFIGDPQRIQQILINILSNAVKYTDIGGKISLRIKSRTETSGLIETLLFECEDNGRGMSEEFLKNVFEPFAREQLASQTSFQQGTGLGMAITKSLIDIMGGTIRVSSKLGEGTTFYFSIPLKLVAEDEDRSFYLSHNLTHMLVVDDEEEVCHNVVESMKGTGVRVECALSGKESLLILQKARENDDDMDVVLLDLKMPEMDGVETAREMRKIVGPDVTIIILTAYDWAAIEKEALAAGVNGFIAKPFFRQSLEKVVDSCVKSSAEIKKAEIAEKAAEEEISIEGVHILAAEDNRLNAEVLQRILAANGASVDVYPDGVQIVDAFKNAKVGEYPLILMDCMMPIKNGYEATRDIRALADDESLSSEKRQEAKDIVIFAVTANAFSDDVQKALAAGMNASFAKPFNIDVLKKAIAKVIKSKND